MVLSFHESFEYVQGAMRLGAIDYISKLRLEQEDCKEVFLRVARLLGCREGERPAEEGVPSQTLEELRQSWESLQWVYDDIRFQEQGERLEKLGCLPARQNDWLPGRPLPWRALLEGRSLCRTGSTRCRNAFAGWEKSV